MRINDFLKDYAPEVNIPKLDLAEIEALPWVSYRTKNRAKEGEPAWIFANTEGAEELVKTIKAWRDQRLELAEYEFRFSGDQKQFVSRRPAKKGGSRDPHKRMETSIKNVREAAERMGVK